MRLHSAGMTNLRKRSNTASCSNHGKKATSARLNSSPSQYGPPWIASACLSRKRKFIRQLSCHFCLDVWIGAEQKAVRRLVDPDVGEAGPDAGKSPLRRCSGKK